jgi:hypothetical protein
METMGQERALSGAAASCTQALEKLKVRNRVRLAMARKMPPVRQRGVFLQSFAFAMALAPSPHEGVLFVTVAGLLVHPMRPTMASAVGGMDHGLP